MCSFHQYLLVCLNNARLSSKQERANIFARLKVQAVYIYIIYDDIWLPQMMEMME